MGGGNKNLQRQVGSLVRKPEKENQESLGSEGQNMEWLNVANMRMMRINMDSLDLATRWLMNLVRVILMQWCGNLKSHDNGLMNEWEEIEKFQKQDKFQ